MKKNSRNNARKERIIMIASSAFVLTALTMTGIYMKSNTAEQEDDGYTIDFTALEDNVQEKRQEIAQGTGEDDLLAGLEEGGTTEDDLDYMPMEAGSGLVELPGLTDRQQEGPVSEEPAVTKETASTGKASEETPAAAASTGKASEEAPAAAASTEKASAEAPAVKEAPQEAPQVEASPVEEAPKTDTPAPETEGGESSPEEGPEGSSGGGAQENPGGKVLHFAASSGLLRPVSGEVLIPYSMDSSTYFSTLDQYKYNSAMMIEAQEDTPVVACAEGRVIEIYENEEIGQAVTMELGDGYQITYGQLKDIRVRLNDYVDCGETFALVAAPTKYFYLEGSNLYLRLTMDGTPVNPEALFRQ